MPKNITANYDSHTKEELLAEIQLRGIEDVKAASPKADIVAALALDDESGLSQPPPPLPPIKASPVPQLPKKTALELLNPAQPLDEQYTDGIYVMANGALKGEPFALHISKVPYAYENTHFLKNSEHSWQGKEETFRLTFDKQ